MTGIVVSRRDGILRAPDGTKHRVARGKTLADADHPAVLANPQDWIPMTVALTVADRPEAPSGAEVPATHEQVAQFENDVAELEETLAQRDAEFVRLVDGLSAAGVTLPAEDDRRAGWVVDLVLDTLGRLGSDSLPSFIEDPEPPQPAGPAPIAPPKPRKRTGPPPMPPAGGNG